MMIAMVFGVIGIGYALKPESAKAETQAPMACGSLVDKVLCVRVEGDDLVVVNLLTNTVVLRQPLPKVTVSGPPITVSLPRVTVVRPPVTVRLPGVTVPGRTVSVNLPGATKTVTLQGSTIDGSQRTITSAPQTIQVTVKGADGQDIKTSVTITPTPAISTVTPKPIVKERKIKVTIPQAIGIGLGVLILGLVLGLLAIYMAYAAGYKDSEDADKAIWRKFRDDVFGKKEKGDL